MRAKIIPSYLAAAVIFFVLSIFTVIFKDKNAEPSFHKEIISADSIGYFDEEENFVPLADGNYYLAMPAGGTFVKGKAPMLLVKVGRDYYPLNIADDSILPRHGKILPLKILFGFTSPHASNTLKYAEKTGKNPVEDYHKKSRYYLHVEKGYGSVQRAFYYQ
ncbi:MAG: hypothetical protein IJT73_01610 [Selenomonadaceae bacterium]|nr:hypothetical protein [Selenomonadaceae bacterium]